MKLSGVIVTSLIISVLTVCAVGAFKKPDGQVAVTAATESVYDRVMKTKTLRCGYAVWPPFFNKDTNTGKFSGFFYDYMEEFGRAFDLKIDWVAEIAYSDIATALNSNRIDAFCETLGAVPSRMINMNFSTPVLYFPFYAYARKDDTRFEHDMNAMNDPNVTLSTMQGEYTSILARTTFPKAKILEITDVQGMATLFTNVQAKKADVIFQDSASFRQYDQQNPGVLHKTGGLVGAIPAAFILKLDDSKMQRLFDYGVHDLENRMITKRLAEKYEFTGKPGQEPDFYLPANGYQQP